MKPVLIDTHTHLDFDQFDADRKDVITRAKEADVAGMITIGINLETSLKAVRIAEKHSNVFAAAGIHPHDAGEAEKEDLNRIIELYQNPKVVAIGEVGLDFYRNLTEPEIQRKIFRSFLDLAKELDLPLIIHTRDAEDEILSILREKGKQGWRGVFHCFPGDVRMAEQVLDMGFYISFTGNITFKNTKSAAVAKHIPVERLMVETDCPFMAPVPHRGRRNEPAFVQHVAQKIAEVKGISFEEVARATTKNAMDLFGLELVID